MLSISKISSVYLSNNNYFKNDNNSRTNPAKSTADSSGNTLEKILDNLVSDGTITQAQENSITTALALSCDNFNTYNSFYRCTFSTTA